MQRRRVERCRCRNAREWKVESGVDSEESGESVWCEEEERVRRWGRRCRRRWAAGSRSPSAREPDAPDAHRSPSRAPAVRPTRLPAPRSPRSLAARRPPPSSDDRSCTQIHSHTDMHCFWWGDSFLFLCCWVNNGTYQSNFHLKFSCI